MASSTKITAFVASTTIGFGSLLYLAVCSHTAPVNNLSLISSLKEIEQVVRDLVFAVPIISAVMIALYNNVFKLYDRIEQAHKESLSGNLPIDPNVLLSVTKKIDIIAGEIVNNAKFAIFASLSIYFLLILRRLFGNYTISHTNFPIGFIFFSATISIVVFIPAILIDQLAVLPGLVQIYRLIIEKTMNHRQRS